MEEYTVTVGDNGDKFWYQNDKLHRLDGPAIEDADGFKEWYQNGKCHREDGPAIEYADGFKAWYIEGKELTEKEFNDRTSASTSCRNKVEVTLKDVAIAMNIDVDKLRIKEH
jgi:hypothetical protein